MALLGQRGHTLRFLGSRSAGAAAESPVQAWRLGASVPQSFLQGQDALIHLAYDFGRSPPVADNVEASKKLFEQAREAGIGKRIFISSYSAHAAAVSQYGRTKFAIEREVLRGDGYVIRPGLVLGDGGIFGRIQKVAKAWPLVPLPDGGYGRMPIIDVGLLCQRIADFAALTDPPRECNLFEPELSSLRELVVRAAEEVGRKPYIVYVPSGLVILSLLTAETAGIALPVSADNLRGFLGNQAATHMSDLDGNLNLKAVNHASA